MWVTKTHLLFLQPFNQIMETKSLPTKTLHTLIHLLTDYEMAFKGSLVALCPDEALVSSSLE